MAFTAEADLFGTPREYSPRELLQVFILQSPNRLNETGRALRRSEKQESKQVNKSSAKERLKELFADKGIVGLKLGTTLVVHECLGVMIMAGTWGE